MFRTKKKKKADLVNFLKTQGLDENQTEAISSYVLERDKGLMTDFATQSVLGVFFGVIIGLFLLKTF